MLVKVEIPVVVGRDSKGNVVYAAVRLSNESLKHSHAKTEEWLCSEITVDWLSGEIEEPMESGCRFVVTAEVEMPEIPGIEKVEGKVEEVGTGGLVPPPGLGSGGGCERLGPGGDCERYIGLHGPDDTVDVYGKPNGWCWSCWKGYQLKRAAEEIERLRAKAGEAG